LRMGVGVGDGDGESDCELNKVFFDCGIHGQIGQRWRWSKTRNRFWFMRTICQMSGTGKYFSFRDADGQTW
jgi:hypothetical protein